MITIKAFEFNYFQENTFVLYDDTKEAVIIDCGCLRPSEEKELSDFITENKLTVKQSLYFVLQLTAFQTYQSVGQCVLLFFLYIFAGYFDQVSQWHDCPADNKIEKLFFLFCPAVTECYVLQTDSFRHGLSDLDLFSDTVNQMELY